ncbi:TIGR02300 family protein [Amaricoccus macauensis]|uniref:TIGR02300 family protein n=1 Tax=Amaricoccus macauensis TaxID=57001 RepID=UPI003C7D1363
MPKEEWGVKRVCPSCSTRFYDLRMDPLTCPNCGASFTVESLTDSRPKALRPEKAKPEPAAEEEDLPDLADSDDVIEGDDDIGDDLLEDDDDNVSLDDIADVGGEDDED